MLLTVFCLRRDRSELTFSLQVDADFELQNFRALCELESGIPAAESQIVYAEVPLTDNHRSLASYGLKDGDVVILQQVQNADRPSAAQFPGGLPRIDFSSITVPGTSAQAAQLPSPQPAPQPRPSPPEVPPAPQGLDNPALLRDMLLSNPHELSLLKERNPPLAEALLSGDLEKFTRVLLEQQQDRARREQERIRLFSADPFDLEAQAKIEEDIRQQNIEENMTIAMEEAPESFGQVVMLYINCKVNGHPVKAFVDSGAQMTIMSQACAERCNIMRLVDRRWAGIAKGVGTQKIIGRVHLAQVQIEGDFLPCSFSILEEQPMDMLLGLDMLKRHQCSIDLKKNVLVIGTTGSQTTFLPEGELPECARLAYGAGREDMRPEEMADHELAEAIQKSVEEAENTDKETTSPEISLLPNSDGFKHPTSFPERGLKTSKSSSRPRNRSASAPSLCSPQHSLAETVNPRAAKSVESLPECPVLLGKEGLPPTVRDLSGCDAFTRVDASLAGAESCCRPNIPSPSPWAEPVPSGESQPCCAAGSGRGRATPLEEVGGNSWPGACAEAGEVATLLPSSHQEQSQVGPKPHKECDPELPPDKQQEPTSWEHVSAMGVSPSCAKGEQAFGAFLSEGSVAQASELKFSCGGHQRPAPALPRPGNETLMEVEVADQALIAEDNLLKEQAVPLSAVNSECSMMEAESSMTDSPLSIDALSTSDLTQARRIRFESTDVSAAVGFSGSPPPEGLLSHQAEDPCPSLASALKELHQLLVVSYKEDLQASWSESFDQPVALPEEKHECSGPVVREAEFSFPEAVGPEALAGAPFPVAGAESVPEVLQSSGLSEQGMPVIQEPLGLQPMAIQSPSATGCQAQGGECFEMLPPCFSSGPSAGSEVLEQDPPPSSRPQGCEPWSALNVYPGGPGVPISSSAGTEKPAGVPAGRPVCPPAVGSAAPPPPVSPSVDVEQIVRAGFTPQEASQALEHAGGNADLALLILLAKNIIVPK